MNPNLAKLYPYPFEGMRLLFKDLAQWRVLFDLSDRHGFVIASDECYSEIYPDEARPPLGALAAGVAAWGDETHVAENRRPMENTASTARSSSNAWMPTHGPRPASTSCDAEFGRTARATPSRGLFKGERQCLR